MNIKPLDVLHKYYGYTSFRKGQENIITSIINKEDVLAIMPTGGGKSICYQVPALCLDGITIVISPLISLMKHQVDALKTMGVKARLINSSLSNSEYNEALEEIFEVLKRCNKYIDETTPWILAKDETKHDRLKTVLYNILEGIRVCAILLEPFINVTSEKILNELNTNERSIESISDFGNLECGITLNKPEILFNRIEINE